MSYSISESEWRVIEVLWKQPNSTVSEVVSSLNHMEWSYSTIKTMLNRLVDKGFAEVDKTAANSFKYRAVVNEQDHKAQETRNFLQKVFNGSVSMMVSTLAKNSKLSKAELEELKRIVDKMEG